MNSTLELSELDTNIGRLFMSGIPGTSVDAATEALIRDHCLGGVILFNRNIEGPMQLASLCNDLQDKAMKYHGIPLFIAIDQEGGRVARLKEPFTVFPGNKAIGENNRPAEMAEDFARITAKEMTLVGLNMNLAPVLDLNKGEPERHLAGRILGDDPEKVALLGQTIVKVLQKNGVMAVAKHFPGLGKTSVDPHHHLPTIEIGSKEMEEANLYPFRAAVKGKVAAVMTSHAVYPALEPEAPASLSRIIITDILRKRIGFKGLVITDDLEMGAISKRWGISGGAVAAFEAGADILLICQGQKFVLESMNALRGKLLRNEIPLKRLHQSVERIMKAKAKFLKKTKNISLEVVADYFGLRPKS